MKKLTIGFLTLLSLTQVYANKSTRIWKNYFPNARCGGNKCAKNVPPKALEEFLEKASYLRPKKLKNTKYAFVSDFSQNSKIPRGFLIDMKTGKAKPYLVSHGVNSGDGNGNAIRFSNRNKSKQSSYGLYVMAETYHGKHGYSLKMDGLESSNSNARRRAIVLHGANYVPNSTKKQSRRIGRSWGCPAVANALSKSLINKLKGGSLYYIYRD